MDTLILSSQIIKGGWEGSFAKVERGGILEEVRKNTLFAQYFLRSILELNSLSPIHFKI